MTNVVILGMEHHNALNVARQLYLGGIKPYGIIVRGGRFGCLKYSKYWQKCTYVKKELEGIEKAIALYGNSKNKAVLITCTDRFAKTVDMNLERLSKFFICPGVSAQGQLTKMMDKQWQHEFACKNSICVVPSISISFQEKDLDQCVIEITSNSIAPPFIIKPIVSAVGDKADILISNDINDLKNNLSQFKNKGYSGALIQHFLNYEYELLVVGACFINCPVNKFILLKINRSYPEKKELDVIESLF